MTALPRSRCTAKRGAAAAAIVLAGLIPLGPAVAQPGDGKLTVCLDPENPPLSSRPPRTAGTGFDLALAAAVAERLGRPGMRPVWYENERDNNRSSTTDVGALLASGACELVAAYPLVEGALGAPHGAPTARLPDRPGPPGPRRPLARVALREMAGSRPYLRVDLIVAIGPNLPADRQTIRAPGDLRGLRLGAVSGSLGGAALLGWNNGALAAEAVTLDARADPLALIAAGTIDATITERPRLDAFRAAHPTAGVEAAPGGWRHPIGFNLGYAALAERADLLAAVDAALAALEREGTLPALASGAGLTWVAPREPVITPRPTAAALRSATD